MQCFVGVASLQFRTLPSQAGHQCGKMKGKKAGHPVRQARATKLLHQTSLRDTMCEGYTITEGCGKISSDCLHTG